MKHKTITHALWTGVAIGIGFFGYILGANHTRRIDIDNSTAYGIASTSMYLLLLDQDQSELRKRIEQHLDNFAKHAMAPESDWSGTRIVTGPLAQSSLLNQDFLRGYKESLLEYTHSRTPHYISDPVIAFAHDSK